MKKQIVSIGFKKEQGVVLKWNYIDLNKKNNFYRHIIVLLTPKIQTASFSVLNYIKNIKCGDLYTTIYSNSYGLVKKKEWREKTYRSDFTLGNYFQEERLFAISFDEAFPIIGRQIQQINEPTILNFILQNQSQIQSMKIKIKQKQIQNKIRFISTLFAPDCLNTFSICQGINTLTLDKAEAFEFYHRFLNQMAIQRAHLIITCRNGQIGSCSQKQWKNTSFNKIQRTYYGPSIMYDIDLIHFHNMKRVFSGSYDLDFMLRFKCFGGKEYTSQKKITINFNRHDIYNRTHVDHKKTRLYYSVEDIELEETPYQSQSFVYFDKSNTEKSNDEDQL